MLARNLIKKGKHCIRAKQMAMGKQVVQIVTIRGEFKAELEQIPAKSVLDEMLERCGLGALPTLISLVASCGLLLAGNAFGGGPSDAGPNGGVVTLLSPAHFTNLFCRSHSISEDNSVLIQERYWVADGNIHILVEDLPNPGSTNSLEGIPDFVWKNAGLVEELIITKEDMFVRSRRPDWYDKWAADTIDKIKKENEGTARINISLPEDWHASHSDGYRRDTLSRYLLSIDDATLADTRAEIIGSDEIRLNTTDPKTNHQVVKVIRFDPVTRLKRLEQRRIDGRLVYEATQQSDVYIDSSQFEIPPQELERIRNPFPSKEVKFKGIGIGWGKEDVGPFTITVLLSNSPAVKAGVPMNGQVIGIDGRSTLGMPRAEFLSLARKKSGNSVTLEIIRPRDTQSKQFKIESAEFSYKAFMPLDEHREEKQN